MVGLSALRAGAAEEVRALARATGAVVATLPKAKGVFPEDDPRFVGTLEMVGDDIVVEFLKGADVVVAAGVDVVEFDKPWRLPAPVIQVEAIEVDTTYLRSEVLLVGDIATSLAALAPDRQATGWSGDAITAHRRQLDAFVRTSGAPLQTWQVVRAVRAALPPGAIAASDVGAHKMVVGQAWGAYEPLTFFMANGLSSMGYSVPLAAAARLVRADRAAVSFVGDGGLAMYLGELETLARLGLDLLVVVLADGTLELIRRAQTRRKVPYVGTSFGNPDFNALGNAFGIPDLPCRRRCPTSRPCCRRSSIPAASGCSLPRSMATTTASEARAAPRWLTGARIVDVRTGAVSPPSSIGIVAGRIATIELGAPTAGSTIISDLGGSFVLPGLITCHVHLQGTYPYSTRDPNEPPQRTALRAAAPARMLRRHGLTTVRSVHELNQADIHVRYAAEMGWTDAPRIVGGGRALTCPGGHGSTFGAVVAQGRSGFFDAAARELEAGAQHIKIFASGGLARGGEEIERPELTLDEMRGAVDAAAARGTYVVAHAAGSAAIRIGLEAGVRSFEHAYMLDEATAAAMAQAGAFLTPTLVVTHASDWMHATGFDSDAVARSSAFAEAHLESARRAIEAGVAIVHGTDIPSDGISKGTTLAVRELELMVVAGATTLGAIQSATIVAARLLGLEEEVGEIRIGAAADLVATPEDPTQSVSALRARDFVVQAGAVVH